MIDKNYIAIVQCHIVKQRCSGYLCEKSFNERKGAFSDYAADKSYRTLYLTCGGCCGRAIHRKLKHLVSTIGKKEGIEKAQIVVQFSSCITKDNYHGPPCPHLDYLRTMVRDKLGLDLREGTVVAKTAEERRAKGLYDS